MKTEVQIKAKIAEHEARINEIINKNEWDVLDVEFVENLLRGRKALLWVMAEEELIGCDEYEMKVDYELLCYESTKIF